MSYGPPSPYYPPPPEKKKLSKKAKIGIGAGIGLFVIIGMAGGWDEDTIEETKPKASASESAEPKPPPAKPAAEKPAEEKPDKPDPSVEDLTRAAFKITWDDTTESDKDLMCASIELFGKDWAKENMQAGGDETDGADLDWDLMADLMERKCKVEGRS